MTHGTVAKRIEHDGWISTGPVLDPVLLDAVIADLPSVPAAAGARNILAECESVRALTPGGCTCARRVRAQPVLFRRPRHSVRTRRPTSNWKVIWHEDLSIAIRERRDVPGYGPWSEKAGSFTYRPGEVLARMLAVRVHLDNCTAENGPVRILQGSHRAGRLTIDAIERCKRPSSRSRASFRPAAC